MRGFEKPVWQTAAFGDPAISSTMGQTSWE
jgi:hypothetical protein